MKVAERGRTHAQKGADEPSKVREVQIGREIGKTPYLLEGRLAN